MVDTTRPTPKQLLPFKQGRDSRGIVLEYQRSYPDGQKCPMYLCLGDPDHPSTPMYYSLELAIYRTLQLCMAMESKVDGLLAENDRLAAQVRVLEGEKVSAKHQMAELKGRQGRKE